MNNLLKPIFSGIQKFTLLDFKDNLSAILFTGGCNFRCSYCHNKEFVLPELIQFKKTQEIIESLNLRKGKLTGIVICGGEPTIYGDELFNWIKIIKEMGFKIKLDSNGTNYKLIQKLIQNNLLDSIAIDYKNKFSKYQKIINNNKLDDLFLLNINKTIEIIINSGIDYEIRTTIHSKLHSIEDIKNIVFELKELNVENFYLQLFKENEKNLTKLDESYFINSQIKYLKKLLNENFKYSDIRNL